MRLFRLENTPNQRFTTYINGYRYDIRLFTIGANTYVDVFLNSDPVCFSALCKPNFKVIPYFNEELYGNFYFYCPDDQYPNYELFNRTHKLYSVTLDELNQLI